MKHLDRDRLVALAEGTGEAAAPEAVHLAGCARCRTELARLRAGLDALREVPVPEPSPLFWDHFSTRVQRAIDEPPLETPARWPFRLPWAVGGLVAACIGVLLMVMPQRSAVREDVAPPADMASATPQGVRVLSAEEAVGEDWSMVSELMAELDYEDVTRFGIVARPGAVEAGLVELDTEERRELVRLIEQELQKQRQS